MRTYGVNEAFRFVEGIRLHRKSRQIRKKHSEKTSFAPYVHTILELPSKIITMIIDTQYSGQTF